MRRVLAVVGFALAATALRAMAAEAPTEATIPPVVAQSRPLIPASRAAEAVGQDVTVEGRVTAIHESPLATVVGFAQNFSGFTVSIMAADRDKFPSDLATRLRDRVVRVSGTITAYRGKPEMTISDPAQMILAPAPGPGSVAAHPTPAPAATADASVEEIRRALARIEGRLDALDARMRSLERPAPDDGEADSGR